jgi:dolichol-phosphate mannosyltransferase
MADEDVCVLIPTYEEGETIADVVAGFRDQGFDDVLVIDGGSSDGTRTAPARPRGPGAGGTGPWRSPGAGGPPRPRRYSYSMVAGGLCVTS